MFSNTLQGAPWARRTLGSDPLTIFALNKLGCINLLQLVTAVQYGTFYYLGAYLYENGTKITIKNTVLYSGLSIGGYVLSQMLSNEYTIMLKMVALLANNIGSLSSLLAIYGIVNLLIALPGISLLENNIPVLPRAHPAEWGIPLLKEKLLFFLDKQPKRTPFIV